MDVVLHDNDGGTVGFLTVADDAERIDFPEAETDVVVASYTLDGVKYVLDEPIKVLAGQQLRLKLWR